MATRNAEIRLEHVAALRLSITRLARRVRRHGEAGLTPSQLSALSTLERHRELSLSRLAELEQVGKASVTRLAAKLEELGLVGRTQDGTDGRVFMLRLTSSGQALLAEASRRADAYLDRQIAVLTRADQRVLAACVPVLERLLDVKA